MLIRLTRDAIDPDEATRAVSAPGSGAVVTFLGTVRDHSGGKTVAELQYDAYEPMAEAKLREVAEEAAGQWPLDGVAVIHRLGRLAVGETSVAIAVSSAHRADAFAACRHIIDRIKEIVPIWKQEIWTDGTTEWVHPDA